MVEGETGARERRRGDSGGGRVRGKCGMGDWGAARLVWRLVASHPPPNLPLEGGRDELGKGWLGLVGSARGERGCDGEGAGGARCVVPACAGMTVGAQG